MKAFRVAHNGSWPVPIWVRDVWEAAGRDLADLDGMTAEQGYDAVNPLLPGGMTVGIHW